MWENFKAAIEKVIQEFVPTRRTLARQTHPWIDNHLRKLTNRKQRAYKRARKTNNPSDWNRYNRLFTQTQREIRQSHRKYMTEVISDSYKDQPKKFWSYIKTRKQESFGIAPLKNMDGFIHSDAKTKAEILNDQFQSVFTQEDTANVPDKGPSPYPTMEDITVHPNGVKKQLTKLNAHKATGPDCIPTAILREAADELAPVL